MKKYNLCTKLLINIIWNDLFTVPSESNHFSLIGSNPKFLFATKMDHDRVQELLHQRNCNLPRMVRLPTHSSLPRHSGDCPPSQEQRRINFHQMSQTLMKDVSLGTCRRSVVTTRAEGLPWMTWKHGSRDFPHHSRNQWKIWGSLPWNQNLTASQVRRQPQGSKLTLCCPLARNLTSPQPLHCLPA